MSETEIMGASKWGEPSDIAVTLLQLIPSGGFTVRLRVQRNGEMVESEVEVAPRSEGTA